MAQIVSRIFVAGLIVALLAWFFADALFFGELFAYRDAAHYYYPLFRFVQSQWAAGNVPLWNPYENLGVPLAADPTASVFYPGKAVFLLPLSYDWCYRLYVIGHVLLAAAAAYWTARRWGAGQEAAGVAALSYGFSGSVLFCYCNVIYLVGAAWLPLAALATDRMLAGRSWRGATGLGIVLAMMILGGDLQAAYHAGLLAVCYASLLTWSLRRGGKPAARRRAVWYRVVLLATAGGAGLLLSAVQWVPGAEYGRHSARQTGATARSLYEIPGQLWRDGPADGGWADGLLCRDLDPLTHHEHVYHFSVGPWRLPELLWPNFGGRQFPTHRRWLEVIPGEGRVWVPSLYMGLLPLLLGMSAVRLRRAEVRDCWLSWMAVLALIASFGWYGLGWMSHEIQMAAGRDPAAGWTVGAPFGGLYWLMTVVLPGYIYFRYPAKLLVVATLGFSLLAARGWDRVVVESPAGLRRRLVRLGGLSLLLAIATTAVRPFWQHWLSGIDSSSLFGPFDAGGAANDLTWAFLQTAVLCAAFWVLFRVRSRCAWAARLTLLILAADLAIANRWMIATAPASLWHQTPELAAALSRAERVQGKREPFRVARDPVWTPPLWKRTASAARLADSVQWDRDTLFPKYNLPDRIAIAQVQGALMPNDYRDVLMLAREKSAAANWLGLAKYWLREAGASVEGAQQIEFRRDQTAADDIALWFVPDHLPRAWIVHEVDIFAKLPVGVPHLIRERTREVFWPDGQPRDLRRSASVESPPPQWQGGKKGDSPLFAHKETVPFFSSPAPFGEWCRIVNYQPSQVEIDARLQQPGLVVLCDQFYPGWQLEVATAGREKHRVPIVRTNRVMRGAWLEPGQHRLVYRYQPASFFWGATISIVAWLGLVLTAGCWSARSVLRWAAQSLSV